MRKVDNSIAWIGTTPTYGTTVNVLDNVAYTTSESSPWVRLTIYSVDLTQTYIIESVPLTPNSTFTFTCPDLPGNPSEWTGQPAKGQLTLYVYNPSKTTRDLATSGYFDILGI